MGSAAKAILASLLLISSNTFAMVTPIHKGDAAAYDGFLFDRDSENQAEQARSDATYYKDVADKLAEQNDLEQKESSILSERLQLYIKESDSLAKEHANDALNDKLIMGGAFVAGVLTVVLVVRNVRP